MSNWRSKNIDISLSAYLVFATGGIMEKSNIEKLKKRFIENVNHMSQSDHDEESISEVIRASFTSNRGSAIAFDSYDSKRFVNMLANLEVQRDFMKEFNESRWVIPFMAYGKNRNPSKYRYVHMNHAIFLAFYQKGINPFLMEEFINASYSFRNRSVADFDKIANHSCELSRELKSTVELIGGPIQFKRFYGRKEIASYRHSPVQVPPSEMPIINEKIRKSMDSGADREMAVAFALLSNGASRNHQDDSLWIEKNPHDLGWSMDFISNEVENYPKPKFNYQHVLCCINNGIRADEFRELLGIENNIFVMKRNVAKIREMGVSISEFARTPKSWVTAWDG